MGCTWIFACGDDGEATGGAGGSGGDTNLAPELAAPETLVIGEGRSAVSAIEATDPEGDELSISVEAPSGIDAEVSESSLLLHAIFGADSGIATITATDSLGASTTAETAIQIATLGWTNTVEWNEGEGPEAREHGSVLVDDASGSIYVMFGSGYSPYLEPLGDAWRFDVATGTWSAVTLEGDVPPPGGSRRLAGRRGSGEGYIYGGYGENNAGFGEVYHVVANGDVLTFEEVPQDNPPGIRFLHVFAFDPGTETFAMFGGGSTTLEGDTWTMRIEDGTAVWTELPDADASPPKRFGAFFGMDEELGRLVLFSGQTSFSDEFGDDTWILDMRAEGGPAWTEVSPDPSPPGRRNGTSVWDPTGPRLFVFGGTSDGATTQPGLFAFDARPGHEGWAEVERDGQPVLRSSGFGAFVANGDELASAVWMGFGNSSDGVYQDMSRLGYSE